MLRLFLLIAGICLWLPQSLNAERIDATKAKAIAQSFLLKKGGKARTDAPQLKAAAISDTKAHLQSAEKSYYAFNVENSKGFVLVSASDKLPEILGYSLDTSFSDVEMPDALKAYLSDYSKIVAAAEAGLPINVASVEPGEAIPPLMSTQWGQDAPFNNLAPLFTSENAPAGCVATAVAQIMYFHKYPSRGHGVVSNNGQNVELGHEYDWDNMLPSYNNTDYSDAQANLIATLMRDVGYALDMNYGANESTAAASMVPIALCKYFNYSTEAKYLTRTSCTTQYWVNAIRQSLIRREPVPYSGTCHISVRPYTAGHEFVCDGIDENNFLHINWGWDGQFDGYFDMNILSPSNLGISSEDAYYDEQNIVVNLRPGNEDADQSGYLADLATSDYIINSNVDESGAVESNVINVSYSILITRTDPSHSPLRAGFIIRNDLDEVKLVAGKKTLSNLSLNYKYTVSTYINLDEQIQSGTLSDGHYRLSAAYSFVDLTPDNYTLPAAGDLNEIGFTISNNQVILDNPILAAKNPVPYMSVVKMECGEIFQGARISVPVTGVIKNELIVPRNQSFYIFLIPEAEASSDVDLNAYNACGTVTGYFSEGNIEVSGSLYSTQTLDVGKYILYVAYYNKDTNPDGTKVGYTKLASTATVYAEVLPQPRGGLMLCKPFSLAPKTVRQYDHAYIDFELHYYEYTKSLLRSSLELWGKAKDMPQDEEFLIGTIDQFNFKGTGAPVTEYVNFNANRTFCNKELGAYTAYLKYKTAEGKMEKIPGCYNQLEFDLVKDEDCFYLTSPMIINNGAEISSNGSSYTEFNVEFELAIDTQRQIPQTSFTPNVYFSPTSTLDEAKHYECLYCHSLTVETADFNIGQPVKCSAVIGFWPEYADASFYGQPIYFILKSMPVNLAPGEIGLNSRWVKMSPYTESTCFIIQQKSDIDDTLSNDSGLPIEVYNLNGVQLPIKTSTPDGIYTKLQPGIYILKQGSNRTKIYVR